MRALNRRRFLGQIGKTFPAGVGLALVPGIAKATTDTNAICCPDSTCPSCGSLHRFRCKGAGCNYCTCVSRTTCFESGPCA